MIIVAGCAVSVAALPWQRHLYGYFVNDAIASMFAIAMDLGCNAWMLEIWQEDANTFMLSMGFVSALGQATSTFLVTPFLSVSEELLPSNMTNATVVASPLLHIVRKSRIRIPYFISGVIALISAGAMLGLYFTSRYKQEVRTMDGKRKKNTDDVLPENEAETETSVSGERTSKCHPIMTMIAGTILVIVYFSTERNTLSYLPSFLTILDEPVDKLTASHMISTLTAVFAAANGLAILISTRVSVSHMLSGFFILIMGGNLLLVSFANTSESMIWVAVVVLGMGHSSAIPCIYSFIEQKINVTNTVVGVFMAAGSVFGVVSTMILGQLMKMYPLTLVYSNLVYISICSLILISLCIRDSGVQTKTHA